MPEGSSAVGSEEVPRRPRGAHRVTASLPERGRASRASLPNPHVGTALHERAATTAVIHRVARAVRSSPVHPHMIRSLRGPEAPCAAARRVRPGVADAKRRAVIHVDIGRPRRRGALRVMRTVRTSVVVCFDSRSVSPPAGGSLFHGSRHSSLARVLVSFGRAERSRVTRPARERAGPFAGRRTAPPRGSSITAPGNRSRCTRVARTATSLQPSPRRASGSRRPFARSARRPIGAGRGSEGGS